MTTKKVTRLFDGDTFVHNNRTFRFRSEYDGSMMGPPWKEHDGHGPVSGWTSRDKYPGERLLHSDRGSKRYYDIAEATRIAKRDGWGLGGEALAALERKLGRTPTRKQIIAAAVERDFDFLQGWCTDQWHWMGVIVEEVETGEEASLWGIESEGDYYIEVAFELADEIGYRLDEVMAAEIDVSRPDMSPAWLVEGRL